MIRTIGKLAGPLFFVFAATVPLWLLQNDYLRGIGVRALIVAVLAVSWNIIGGFGGRLSFGHAAFFGIGAYTSSLLLVDHGISPWIGGVVGMLVAAVVALLVGLPTLRLRGIFFTLVTFVFTLILLTLARYFSGLTGGDVGLSLPLTEPSLGMMQFRGQLAYYYLALAVLAVYVVIAAVVSASSFGYRLRAIRDDEEVAEALGVPTTKVKLQGFMLSAGMAAFAGTLAAQQDLFIDPGSAFGVTRSVEIALGAIFGGIGTVWGPVVGGIALVAMSDGLNNVLQDVFAGADTIVYGIALVAVALWLPGGLASLPRRLGLLGRRRHAPTPPEASMASSTEKEHELR
ncbi:branched-chain amino acid transport system permease protein [Modestobacter sp. DSM 44400]|uniref:branched-chain amino acid ABC transporter permease n=1 Tax=Modestobacter sp. DSM 44400 TaxID=1550230 RepID=UPI00089523C4|nr:branched-chain amino acid ABC transporter permease [Modestobacter sp. DSM 44400]SDX99776.1 branched-chain amino acid transport system permease protein [Modestobacter sp. DSM 44400]